MIAKSALWLRDVPSAALCCVVLSLFTCALQAQNLNCPVSPLSSSGKSFKDQTLKNPNFAHQNLQNADFSNATLIAPFFTGADLTGAKFVGTTFQADPANPLASPNFLFAKLDSACFIHARFEGPTDLTGASLNCADFSETDLTTGGGNALFGELPLNVERGSNVCRTAFRGATMSCEFMNEWQYLDLTGANVTACLSQMTKLDFTDAKMPLVNFQNGILDGAIFTGADLTQAVFSQASLQGANLQNAKLYGAKLNGANLDGANMGGVYLTKPPGVPNASVANLNGAFMRNVNLSQARLSDADLGSVSFYSISPVGTGICTPDTTGFTKDCATVSGTLLDNTQFGNAYLFGVDFTKAKVHGVFFKGAVLAGANFNGASVAPGDSGQDSGFEQAFLQGANLAGINLTGSISFQDAYLDFRPDGNTVFFQLDGTHTTFPGYWNSPPGQPVCVQMVYTNPTTVPQTDSTTTCPDHLEHAGGCGPANPDGSNANWKSAVDISTYASYRHDATYTRAPVNGVPKCSADFLWSHSQIP
jgi:uncharacterized protein YjbI with pentapeptide repeats